MGGLAALFLEPGGRVDLSLFQRMCAAVPYRAQDGAGIWTGDGAAVARLRAGATGPLEAPLVDAARHLVVAFDGRLDNREELLQRFALDASASDARLALEAIAERDVDAPAMLLGDFAFIAWHTARRRLLLARDHMGLRPLHFATLGTKILCGSDMTHVLADASVPRRPNARVAAEYLTCTLRNGADTLYDGISRVPPAHTVVIENGVARQHRYWSAEPARRVEYRSDDHYAEHCRALLVRSVSARLRGSAPVAATLSGGIDSSSVALVAHLLVRDHPPPGLFSMVFPGNPAADERPFIEAVAARCGATPTFVPPSAPTRTLAARAAAWMDAPSMAADQMAEGMYDAMRARGYRAALTGAGGDFAFAGSIFHYADLLRQGRLLALARRYRDDRRADDTGKGPLVWLQAGLWPALPCAVKRPLRPAANWAASRTGVIRRYDWLRHPVEKEALPDEPRGGSFAVEDLVRSLTSGLHSYVLEGGERAAAEAGVELRHPLLDVRLTEFVLAIPEEQRRRGPVLKFVLRQALRAELPELVATRTTKGDFAHCVWDAVEGLGGESFFRSLCIADAGWVDGGRVVELYRRMRADLPAGPVQYGRHIPEIWMISAVELWFRAAFGGVAHSAL